MGARSVGGGVAPEPSLAGRGLGAARAERRDEVRGEGVGLRAEDDRVGGALGEIVRGVEEKVEVGEGLGEEVRGPARVGGGGGWESRVQEA